MNQIETHKLIASLLVRKGRGETSGRGMTYEGEIHKHKWRTTTYLKQKTGEDKKLKLQNECEKRT